MSDFGFVGPSYEAASIYQEAQECINFYPEIDPLKPPGSRGVVALYPTPGLTSILPETHVLLMESLMRVPQPPAMGSGGLGRARTY